jgi:hypothetical protein
MYAQHWQQEASAVGFQFKRKACFLTTLFEFEKERAPLDSLVG